MERLYGTNESFFGDPIYRLSLSSFHPRINKTTLTCSFTIAEDNSILQVTTVCLTTINVLLIFSLNIRNLISVANLATRLPDLGSNAILNLATSNQSHNEIAQI